MDSIMYDINIVKAMSMGEFLFSSVELVEVIVEVNLV